MSATARFGRAQSTAAPVVVARQPILDRAEQVIGFELLSPPDETATVLVQSLADIGLSRLVGPRPAHINVTRELLLAVRPLPLSAERVVIELPAPDGPDDLLLMVARELREARFRVALDGYRDVDGVDDLLRLVSIVKAGVGSLDAAAVAALHARGLQVIADGVETREQFEACRALGFDGFQGRFFAEPVIVPGAATPTYRLRALSLLARGDMSSFEQLERVISEDPGLSLKLVRLANSAFFGRRHPIGSIRQALVQLGTVAVRRWATLLVLAGVTDRPNHLLELGLLRARLCELVASRSEPAEPDRAFTIGLFSVVDTLLRMPMDALLAELPFDDRTKLALARHEGPEGRVLGGVLAYEAGDFAACSSQGIGLVDIALAYREALDWTGDATLQLAA